MQLFCQTNTVSGTKEQKISPHTGEECNTTTLQVQHFSSTFEKVLSVTYSKNFLKWKYELNNFLIEVQGETLWNQPHAKYMKIKVVNRLMHM